MQISGRKFLSMIPPAWQIWIILQMYNFGGSNVSFLSNRNYVFTAFQMYNSLWLIPTKMVFIVPKKKKNLNKFLCVFIVSFDKRQFIYPAHGLPCQSTLWQPSFLYFFFLSAFAKLNMNARIILARKVDYKDKRKKH